MAEFNVMTSAAQRAAADSSKSCIAHRHCQPWSLGACKVGDYLVDTLLDRELNRSTLVRLNKQHGSFYGANSARWASLSIQTAPKTANRSRQVLKSHYIGIENGKLKKCPGPSGPRGVICCPSTACLICQSLLNNGIRLQPSITSTHCRPVGPWSWLWNNGSRVTHSKHEAIEPQSLAIHLQQIKFQGFRIFR